jgi:hypothetical protein
MVFRAKQLGRRDSAQAGLNQPHFCRTGMALQAFAMGEHAGDFS